jgi:hypothetical protein
MSNDYMFKIDDLDVDDDSFEMLGDHYQHAMSWLFKDEDPAVKESEEEEQEVNDNDDNDEEEISHYDTEDFLQYLGLDRISELEKLFVDVMKVSVQCEKEEVKSDKSNSWWSWWWNGEEKDNNVKKNQ